MTSPWMSSPYATPTQIIDGVQTPAPAPIPGLMPLSVPSVGVPPIPAPFLGVPPLGVHPAYAPGYGVSPLTLPQMGIPPVPFLPFGTQVPPIPFLGVPSLPFSPFGAQQAIAPTPGVPPVPAPFLGVPPMPTPHMGIYPAYTLGFDMQTIPWSTASQRGHAISPVAAMLLSQLGLREAASRIGDEALKQRLINGVNETLDHTIEGLAGMGLHPWFGPGAQFMIYPVAAELALIAQRYPDGDVHNALLTIAGQILQKSLAPTGEGGGRRRQ